MSCRYRVAIVFAIHMSKYPADVRFSMVRPRGASVPTADQVEQKEPPL